MKHELSVVALYRESEHSLAYPYLLKADYPWEILAHVGEIIADIAKNLSSEEYEQAVTDVWIAKSATVAPTASITGPCIIGAGAEIRHCAYIRGNVIVGDGAVVGNSTELKNCILFDGVQVPHYNYVGDSILGYKSHLGAGAVTSNVKSDKTPVTILFDDERIETGRKKLGAMIGDRVEVGCNSVLNPGTVIGCDSNVYPRSSVRGYVAPNSIFKDADNVVTKH